MAALALIVVTAVAAAARLPRQDLTAAQARVEALYAAGSLPEALGAAREGLEASPDDPILLRRACQLALALRVPEVARASADRLEARVRSEDLAGWRPEAERLGREADELVARERDVEDATVRARAVSIASIAALAVLVLALSKGSRPPP
jgi:hypothetical protein